MLIVGFLHFSDPMETEEKTGSALVGKTPDTVSGLLKVFFSSILGGRGVGWQQRGLSLCSPG